jgi:hypothetical protein
MQQLIENFEKDLPEFTLEIINDVSQEIASSEDNVHKYLESIFQKIKNNNKLIVIIEYNEKTKYLYKNSYSDLDKDKIIVFSKNMAIHIDKQPSLDKIKKLINRISSDDGNYECNICTEKDIKLSVCLTCHFYTCSTCEIMQYIYSIKNNKLKDFKYECPQCRNPFGNLCSFSVNNISKMKEEGSIFNIMLNKRIELDDDVSDKAITCFALMQMLYDYTGKNYIEEDNVKKLITEIIALSFEADENA